MGDVDEASDGRAASMTRNTGARRRLRMTPTVSIALGVALNVLSFVGYEGPGSTESLDEYVAHVGNHVRTDALGSLLMTTPSYPLIFLGFAALLRRWQRSSRLLRVLVPALTVSTVVLTIFSLLRAVIGLVGVGMADADSSEFVITAPQWLVDLWYPVLIGGLNAFLASLRLSLVGLVVVAAHTPVAGPSEPKDGRSRFRIKPTVAIALGFALYLFGAALWSFDAVRPASLDDYVAQVGALFRRDALLSLTIMIPGYLLAFGGIAAVLRRRREMSRLLSLVSGVIVAATVTTAALDIVGVGIGQIAVGTADIESPEFVITAPQWLTAAWFPLFTAANIGIIVCLGLSFLGLIVNAAQRPDSHVPLATTFPVESCRKPATPAGK